MPAVYGHFYGNEAEELLAESFGLKEIKKETLPELVICPNCREYNNPDAPFCNHCRTALTITGHLEREDKLEEALQTQANLKEEMSHMRHDFESYSNQVNELFEKVDIVVKQRNTSINFLSKELQKYQSHFGYIPLTDIERGKLREAKAAIEAIP
jgi:hypothetical protein